MRFVPESAQRADWPRLVAEVVNSLVRRMARVERGYTPEAEPADPVEGQTYYDATLQKVRTFDGWAWQDHW